MTRRELSAKANYVPPAENAHKEIRALLGFEIVAARRGPIPAPDDRNSRNEPARQSWILTLANGGIAPESSDDIREPALLNAVRYAATRQLGNESTYLPPLSRSQCARVLVLLHQIEEESR